MYKPLFGNKSIGEKEGMVFFDLEKDRNRTTLIGEFESDILCEQCERKISKWEDYARKVLYGGRFSKTTNISVENLINRNGVEYSYIKGLDYKLLKLFLLSILWRSSISSRSFFENVSLGPSEEDIRKMLINEDPRKRSSYPCVISRYKYTKILNLVIPQPGKKDMDQRYQCPCYSFLISGTQYYYFMSSNIVEPWILESTLNEDGELRLLHMPKEHGDIMLNTLINKFKS